LPEESIAQIHDIKNYLQSGQLKYVRRDDSWSVFGATDIKSDSSPNPRRRSVILAEANQQHVREMQQEAESKKSGKQGSEKEGKKNHKNVRILSSSLHDVNYDPIKLSSGPAASTSSMANITSSTSISMSSMQINGLPEESAGVGRRRISFLSVAQEGSDGQEEEQADEIEALRDPPPAPTHQRRVSKMTLLLEKRNSIPQSNTSPMDEDDF
jgi:hypothetical protein